MSAAITQSKNAAISAKIDGVIFESLTGVPDLSYSVWRRLNAIARAIDPQSFAARPIFDMLINLADEIEADCDLEDDGTGEPWLGWGPLGPAHIFEGFTDIADYEAKHCLDLEFNGDELDTNGNCHFDGNEDDEPDHDCEATGWHSPEADASQEVAK